MWAYDSLIRIGFFVGILSTMAAWELLARRRPLLAPKRWRWLRNFALVVLDTLCLRLVSTLLIAGLAIGAAIKAEQWSWGLLNQTAVPYWVEIAVTLLVFDVVIYAQHVAFHKIPVLWRIHRVHHSDLDFDVTTALRFHPIEIVLSMGIKMGLALALGAPPAAVLAFEVILNGMAMFNHGNVRLPAVADRLLRLALVTPDMHRVHHSAWHRETDSNYGFNLSWWDRLFRTYRPQPRDGHDNMRIGLDAFRDAGEQTLWWVLRLPFR